MRAVLSQAAAIDYAPSQYLTMTATASKAAKFANYGRRNFMTCFVMILSFR